MDCDQVRFSAAFRCVYPVLHMHLLLILELNPDANYAVCDVMHAIRASLVLLVPKPEDLQ